MKTLTAGMITHIEQTVTTLAACWRLTREDGTAFHFTSHDQNLDIDLNDGEGTQTYKASTAFNRTAVKNDDSLGVDNLNIQGGFDSADIDEDELQLGLFDHAVVEVFMVNWEDLTDGIIWIRKGRLGEATLTSQGAFFAELRGLTQNFSRRIGKLISPTCRTSLGSTDCGVPLAPPNIKRNQTVAVGEFYRVQTNPVATGFIDDIFLASGDGVDGATTAVDDGPFNRTPTFVANAEIDTAQSVFGGASLFLDGTGDQVDWSTPDTRLRLNKTGEFTIDGWVRFLTLPPVGAARTFISWFDGPTNQRAWDFDLFNNAGTREIRFLISTNGTGVTSTKAENWSPVTDVWYHVAVTRDSSNDIRIFVDGVQLGSPTNDASIPFNSTTDLTQGSLNNGFNFFGGHLDDWRINDGHAYWTTNFTPPTEPHPTDFVLDDVLTEVYEDRIYEVTTAGVTADTTQPTYDTVVGNTTADGTAVLTAREAWTRAIEVSAVDGVDPQKKFTVTELTPNTLFPDGWFELGAVTFETGNNSGLASKSSMETRDYVPDDGITITQDLELFLDMPFDIVVTDKARITPGCDKLATTCQTKFDNIINFRGEPFVPGQDAVLDYPDAKS
jgi:uncharacterized phage protein (TIGR02218 family)